MSDPPPPGRPVYVRPLVWIVYAVLFGVAIPWYWPADSLRMMFGIPLWAAVSIGSSALISVFTAWLLVQFWPDDEDEGNDSGD